MKFTRLRSVIMLAPLAFAASCTNASHLIIYQHSTLGMNTAVNPSTQAVHFRVGVRQQVAAIVPKFTKKVKVLDSNGRETGAEVDEYEATSAYFGSRFRLTSIWKIPETAQVLTTGKAAVIAASEGRLQLKESYDKTETAKTEEKPGNKPEETPPVPAPAGDTSPQPDVAGLASGNPNGR